MAFIWEFDAEEVKRIDESGSARRVKREYIKRGYVWSLSIYGVLTHTETGESEYRRIEILSDTFWTDEIVSLIYDFFKRFKPPGPYSIWIYNDAKGAVSEVGRYK